MTNTKPPRIGPKMRQAIDYIAMHPGCSKHAVAIAVGPHGSTNYGSRIVERVIKTGLVTVTGDRKRYYLALPEWFQS